MDALFVFEVGYSPSRPVTPDAEWTWVAVLGHDSPAGFIEARWVAVAMASGCRANAMVTSARLVDVEL